MTDTLIIADYYEKRHHNVMRAIRDIMTDLPELEGVRIFVQSSYVNLQGKQQPKIIMNHDGAKLLTSTFKAA